MVFINHKKLQDASCYAHCKTIQLTSGLHLFETFISLVRPIKNEGQKFKTFLVDF